MKVLRVGVAELVRNFGNGLAATQKQLAGRFEPLRLNKASHAGAKQLPEAALQAELVELALAGQAPLPNVSPTSFFPRKLWLLPPFPFCLTRPCSS